MLGGTSGVTGAVFILFVLRWHHLADYESALGLGLVSKIGWSLVSGSGLIVEHTRNLCLCSEYREIFLRRGWTEIIARAV